MHTNQMSSHQSRGGGIKGRHNHNHNHNRNRNHHQSHHHNHRPKTKQHDELEEADAIVSEALNRGPKRHHAFLFNNDDHDDNSSRSSDSSGVDSFDEEDAELDRILERRRMLQSRGLISSRFEVESLLKNGQRRDLVILQERRRSNYMLVAICALLFAVTCLVLDKKHSAVATADLIINQENKKENTTSSSTLEQFLNENESKEGNTLKSTNDSGSSETAQKKNSENEKSQQNDDEITPDEKIEPELVETVTENEELTPENFEKESSLINSSENTILRLERLVKWNLPFNTKRDIIFFWHIPLTGSLEFQLSLSLCYNLVIANDIGIGYGHENDSELTVFKISSGAQFMNVDASTKDGLIRAKSMGLGNSDTLDVIVSSYFYDAADLFSDATHTGKCITILRHPVERGIALFHRLQEEAKKENHPNNALKEMTIEEYANGPFSEDNWMTRVLTNELEKPLTFHHLELAKEILGRKCLIGIFNNWSESMKRFQQYFGWQKHDAIIDADYCGKVPSSNNDHSPGGHVWNLFAKKNGLDIALYEYSINLFEKQKMYSQKKAPPQSFL